MTTGTASLTREDAPNVDTAPTRGGSAFGESHCYPDREGRWRMSSPSYTTCLGYFVDAETFDFDVYPLDPACGILCAWCDEVGLRDIALTQFWDSDEWLGHIPVHFLASPLRTFYFLDNSALNKPLSD